MDAGNLKLMAADPGLFRAHLVIPGARGPVRLGEAMADFQRADFAALDRGFLALASGTKPEPSRFWLERTKGASKDSDLAVMLLWLLLFSNRPLTCQVGAADADQADELRKAAKGILRLNRWVADGIEIQSWSIQNKRTEGRADILAADVAGSHGARPDVLVMNELSHVAKQEFAENLMDNSAKVPHGIVIIATNAGHIDSWQHRWRQTAETSPRWYFSKVEKPAPWLDPAEIEEARRRNSANRFARLWEGQWVHESSDCLSSTDINAAIRADVPMTGAAPGWLFVAGLDIGLSQDATALVVIGKKSERYRLAYCRRWLPTKAKRVDLAEVEKEILEVHRRFKLRLLGFDPFQAEYLTSRLKKAKLSVEAVPFTGVRCTSMATMVLDCFASGSIDLYQQPDLLADLRRLRIVEKSYGMKLESPRGPTGHGDLATALAIALLVGKESAPMRTLKVWTGNDSKPSINFNGMTYGFAVSLLESSGVPDASKALDGLIADGALDASRSGMISIKDAAKVAAFLATLPPLRRADDWPDDDDGDGKRSTLQGGERVTNFGWHEKRRR